MLCLFPWEGYDTALVGVDGLLLPLRGLKFGLVPWGGLVLSFPREVN